MAFSHFIIEARHLMHPLRRFSSVRFMTLATVGSLSSSSGSTFFTFHFFNTVPDVLPFVGRLDGSQRGPMFTRACPVFAIFDVVCCVFVNPILSGCLGGAGRPIQRSRVGACIRN
jgi:hypothetical protein